jgi:uncharacterized membrane protein SirB2
MSYAAYKLIHLLGIFSLMVALAGMAVHAAAGHTKKENPSHRTLLALHGVGALLALTGGFGLLARINVQHGEMFDGWIWGKILLWIILGGMVALPYRSQGAARLLVVLLPVLGVAGAFLAVYKPF